MSLRPTVGSPGPRRAWAEGGFWRMLVGLDLVLLGTTDKSLRCILLELRGRKLGEIRAT